MRIESIITLAFALFIVFISTAQTFVPDDNFERALINLGFDSGPLDNFVPTENIKNIKTLDIPGKNISDLTGIEDFASLSILNCAGNNLTSLDLSKNTSLTQLYCSYNNITSLNTSKNINAVGLHIKKLIHGTSNSYPGRSLPR